MFSKSFSKTFFFFFLIFFLCFCFAVQTNSVYLSFVGSSPVFHQLPNYLRLADRDGPAAAEDEASSVGHF